MYSFISDVIYDHYETAKKLSDGFQGLFSLELCYTLWPVGIDKSWPIHMSSQFVMLSINVKIPIRIMGA
jgi:hypothetical protein